MTILIATGLMREARILAGSGTRVVVGGGASGRLEADLDRLVPGMAGILSIGIAGALEPGLRPGDWVVDGEAAWSARLAATLPGARRGGVLGQDHMVAEAADKAALHRETGALAVDMESHIAARVAYRHGLPFAAARVISDGADRSLPPAARVGMRPDGGMNLPAVLLSLARNPLQLPALIRTGWEAERAFRALLRGHDALGPGLAGPTG
ncbi:phosphorylase family protein [Roseomonas populi]|uniref:Hopanoid-associated phosphorylase n=1 Tax=Roseomonas populi TaxID=3121582 RepID=A0ABT1XCV6_9PROT|nr:hopanoid-associated phosphorylase [Roseomonas pecuniae]MCR0984829.1 hopanoid-associated phosphorylase [Roseomonas pecuniae]